MLTLLLFLFLLLAGCAVVYPLKEQRAIAVIVLLIFMASVGLFYHYKGHFKEWSAFNEQTKVRDALFAKGQSADDLIKKIQEKLKHSPQSAKGWYLLGRLYEGKGAFDNAIKAYAKAYDLNPDEPVTVHYIFSLWEKNHQQFNSKILSLLHSLLQKNANQSDALALLAMYAYQKADYQMAIHYWRRLLILMPIGSDEAKALKKAIRQAEEKLRGAEANK